MTLFYYKGSDSTEAWVRLLMDLCTHPRFMTSGSRKIFRGLQFDMDKLDDTLNMEDSMYLNGGRMKLQQLQRYYINAQSLERAVDEWPTWSIKKRKYGSVGISTHGMQKGGFTKQGFCIQSIVVSNYPARGAYMDIYYRTTEVVKKFHADLIFLRECIVPRFDWSKSPLRGLRFHFANTTLHPMFYWLVIPHLEWDEWMDHANKIKKEDPEFYKDAMTWCRRYLENKPTPFAQAQKAQNDLHRSLTNKQKHELWRRIERSIGRR
jgi:hypothetical protein